MKSLQKISAQFNIYSRLLSFRNIFCPALHRNLSKSGSKNNHIRCTPSRGKIWYHFVAEFLCNVFNPQVLTRDSVTVSVDAVVYYRVSNATISVANVENAHHSTRLLAQTTMRNILGTKNLHEILSERESISRAMQVSWCIKAILAVCTADNFRRFWTRPPKAGAFWWKGWKCENRSTQH